MSMYETIAESAPVLQPAASGTDQAIETAVSPALPAEAPWDDFGSLGGWLIRHDAFVEPDSVSPSSEAAEAVFGSRSLLVESAPANLPEYRTLASGAVYQVSVVVLLLAYTLLLYRFRSDIASIFVRHKTQPDDQVAEGLNNIYTRFFSSAFTVGLLTAGIMVVKGLDILIGPSPDLPYWLVLGAVPIVACILLLIVLVQSSMLWAIGRLTLYDGFIGRLMRVKRIWYTIFTIVCTPLILLYALGPRGSYDMFMYLIGIEIVALVVIFLYKTYALFVDKKISILHWFLYLCNVELFPVSLIVLLIFRKS